MRPTRLRLGGHDPRKVYAAYKTAVEHKGGPTVILARTIKVMDSAKRARKERHAPAEELNEKN